LNRVGGKACLITAVAILAGFIVYDILTTGCERRIEKRCLEQGRNYQNCMRLWGDSCE